MSDAFLPVERIQDLTDGPGEMGPSDHGKFMTWDDTAGHMVMVALPKPERPQVVGVAFGGGTGGGGGTTDHAALTHLDFVSSGHTGFEAVGAGAAAVSAHVALANPHSQYLLASAISAYGLTLVDAADAATARNTLGLGSLATAGVPGSTTQVIFNNAGALAGDAGMTYDPATDALTVAGRVVTGVIRPPSDSATAVQVQNAAGTSSLFVVDTSNSQNRFQYGAAGATATDGIVFKRRSPDVAGRSTLEISGSNAAVWTAGKGIEFENHTANIKIGAPVAFSSAIALDSVYLGSSAVGNTDESIWLTATGGKVTLNAMKYASSPYPDVYLSCPNFFVYTKTGAAWSDGSAAGTPYGSQRFKIKDSGLVAIGSHDPTATLDVAASTTTIASLRIRPGAFPTGANRNDGDIGYVSSGRLTMYRQSTEEIFATGVQATGGAATAGATYGATEQTMLQAVYNVARTFGLLS